jgi:DNA-binding transcriptional regulator YhcF (GntR family)
VPPIAGLEDITLGTLGMRVPTPSLCIDTMRQWLIQWIESNSQGCGAHLIIAVDEHSPVPPYEQVRAQIANAISQGELGPEERLPTVRQLAADLGLAANTVARSFRELEASGLLETRGRHGTFVAGAPSESRRQAERATRDYTRHMRQLGLNSLEILATVRREVESADQRH